MIDPPALVDVAEQMTAMIRVTVPRNEIQKVMGPGIQEVYAALSEQGITSAGPWFTHHLKKPDEIFDFEICVPVDVAVTPLKRVVPGRIRACRVARTTYHGGFDGLGNAWGAFLNWTQAQNLKAAADFWEVYLSGPSADPDPSTWATQLNQPLAD